MEEVPFDDRRVPRAEIDWERSLWWWYPLTRSIHPAMRMTSLLVASVTILLGQFGFVLASWLFAPRWSSELVESLIELQSTTQNELSVFADGGASSASGMSVWIGLIPNGQALLTYASQGNLFAVFGLREMAYVSFILVWTAITIAIGGGILARRAVVELGQRTIAPWGQTVRLVLSRWAGYLWASGMSLLGLAVVLVIPLSLGFIARLNWLAPIAGVILLLVYLPLVFSTGRLLFSSIVCYPLSVCAISTERKADAFEGFSRSNAYFFQRPIVVFLLTVALAGVGWIGYQILFWIIAGGWYLTRDVFLLGAGTSTANLADTSRAAESAVVLPWVIAGTWLASLLLVAYKFSFFWSASAAVYLIARRCVDNTELEEMDLQEVDKEVSLPPIPPPPSSAAPSESTASQPDSQVPSDSKAP